MTEPWNQETVDRLLGRLSHQDLERILGNLLWDIFGDVTDAAHEVLAPERCPDAVDVESLLTSLRQEFWPERYPAGDVDDEPDDFGGLQILNGEGEPRQPAAVIAGSLGAGRSSRARIEAAGSTTPIHLPEDQEPR
jgi:hypothetical protein